MINPKKMAMKVQGIKNMRAGKSTANLSRMRGGDAGFHFTVNAESPQINVTIAPINLKLPPPQWPQWPQSEPHP